MSTNCRHFQEVSPLAVFLRNAAAVFEMCPTCQYFSTKMSTSSSAVSPLLTPKADERKQLCSTCRWNRNSVFERRCHLKIGSRFAARKRYDVEIAMGRDNKYESWTAKTSYLETIFCFSAATTRVIKLNKRRSIAKTQDKIFSLQDPSPIFALFALSNALKTELYSRIWAWATTGHCRENML